MKLPSQEALLGRGRTAEIFAWQEHQVIKLFYAEFPPELAEFEMAKSQLISTMDLPTPKFFGKVEIGGRIGLVYERIYGTSMLKMINQHPWLLLQMAKLLAGLHYSIHQQDGTGFPPLAPEMDKAIQRLDSFPGIPVEKVTQILKGLPDGNTLCHLDFHPDQVMMTNRGPVILDWSTAYSGHPLADVARTTILLKIGQVPYGGRVMRTIINLWRGLFLRTYQTSYFGLQTSMQRGDLTPWLIPVALGRMNEGIAGEQKALLGVIAGALDALGITTSSPTG